MKKSLPFLFATTLFLSANSLLAQSTEDFEDETLGSSTFTDNGQMFSVSSTAGETYDIFNCANCGWNGTAPDLQFYDNSGGSNGTNNGSSFTVVTSDGTDIIVSSLYLFCATTSLANHTGTLTLTGRKEGAVVFSITKSTGFANPVTLTPNNGFTFIDFATEGMADYSASPIDELIFSSTGNLDYMALDAFTWNFASALSTESFTQNSIEIVPNPASDFITFQNAKSELEYKIFDALGRKIENGIINSSERIDVSSLDYGMYFVQLENSKAIKFIKN
ncbi:T9SS type A sorting domain-containing protein [Sungkyunkwania multivorans]|uniref:T9SS type A sorting domain-containing protein n=1 Tax=Sungkyunkwania multivorans TaxID=1173618 RepID=A0ABW3D2R8_9FLAO